MRRGLIHALAVVTIAAIGGLSVPAVAAEGPLGIGFAQAEEGTWWCQAMAAAPALDCARQKCEAESGGQECHATRWCYPAGWSALMVVWLPEFHSTHALCGMPGRDAAIAAMKAVCDAGSEFTQCDLVLTIDPDGTQDDTVGITWPGPAASPATP
jgi:hypothetical protein